MVKITLSIACPVSCVFKMLFPSYLVFLIEEGHAIFEWRISLKWTGLFAFLHIRFSSAAGYHSHNDPAGGVLNPITV
jgi:hypothetical protein